MGRRRLGSAVSGVEQMTDYCVHGDELPSSVKCGGIS